MWKLAKDTQVLDVNSAYSYMMLCKYFNDTCAIAENNGRVIGFVTAFKLPADQNTLFIWQIGVDAEARGQGLGSALITHLLEQSVNIQYIAATISPSNDASQNMFRKLAKRLDANLNVCPKEGLSSSLFPSEDHEAEYLYRIGPINT